MNEEVKIERQLDVFKYTPDEIYDYIYDLKQENHQLKDRIEKAIECLENWNCFECDKGTMREINFSSNKEDIIEILKGENKELKEIHYLIQGGRGNGKTFLTKLQQQDLYKSVIDEIKGIVEETNYLANKAEIVNRGNIELHGVIDRLCLILRKIKIIDKAKESEESEIENN